MTRKPSKDPIYGFFLTIMRISTVEKTLAFELMLLHGLAPKDAYRITSDTLDLACGMELVDV